ncbi:MAG: hypothetical protein U9R23_02325 [Candidatus Cloacimonadota bacterium]|nr:hypothetical protein [Candidatus Cloacimonadota bacterium]
MKCITDKKLLDYLNGEVKSKQKEKISRHINKCETCQRRLNEWKKVMDVTKEFTQTDKKNIKLPQFDTIINKPQIEPFASEESSFSWLKYWLKPAIVTAAVAVLVLFAIIFVPLKEKISVNPNYVVFENEYKYTEAYLIDDEFIIAFEQSMLKEIYQDEELRDKILYESWEYLYDIIDLLSDEDIKFLENKINTLKTT